MITTLMPLPKQQFLSNLGLPLIGGKVYTYAAGTNNPKATYTDSAGAVPQANPILLNVRGEPASPIYWSGSYKVVVQDALGNTIYTVDNFNTDPAGVWSTLTTLAASAGATLLGFLQRGANAVATTIAEVLQRRVSVWDYMTDDMRTDALSGNPGLDHAPAFNAAITALNGAGRVEVPRKGSAVYLLKSTVNLGASNAVDSSVVIDFEPGIVVRATLADNASVLFSLKNVPGHFNNQGIKNLHVNSTNGLGSAVKFSGQCFGSFENNYIEGFNVGLFFSNAGEHIFNEFIRFTNLELHLNNAAILMDMDGGTDTSMHGLSFRSTTINVGSGQVGLQVVDTCWYNADFDLKFFCQADSQAIIKMTTTGNTYNKGVFGSGSITCEGPAKVIGTGRFYFPTGFANFDVGMTDTLDPPNAWEQGFMCANYVRARNYGTSGYTVAEVSPKSGEYGTTGPVGSFVRLRAASVESLLANCYGAHASTAGNGFYTGYTGYQQNYEAGILGVFLSSDGTEIASKAPTSTQCQIKHNGQTIMRFDGQARTNNTEGFWIGTGGAAVYSGTGSPEGVVTASVGSTFRRRDGGTTTTFYVKESGTGNTGWVAK